MGVMRFELGRRPSIAASVVFTLLVLLVGAAVGVLHAQGRGPVTDQHYRNDGQVDAEQAELGRLLFFDPLLSGNRNISCATCHHPLLATSDALSLPLGEGGAGLGSERNTGSGPSRVRARVPRNAPALFNLGARQFRALFDDGRVAEDEAEISGFATPAGALLPLGLTDVVAAQAMFPVTSPTEMAGHRSESGIGRAAAEGRLAGEDGVWDRLANRLRRVPEYVDLFERAFGEVTGPENITFVHAANAISAYEVSAWRSDQSPFDRFLRGEEDALTQAQRRGMNLFSGRADCTRCHSGVFQTDQRFHPIAMPQIDPGAGDGADGHDDFGRERVTGNIRDRFSFRTPSLRNVELTGPWGHTGAYASLEAVVRHYSDPVRAIRSYDPTQAVLPSRPNLDAYDLIVMSDPARVQAIADAARIRPARLRGEDVADLVAFLRALTDPRARDLSADVPDRVPSGLPLQ